MKKTKITFIIGCLIFFSASLFAQNTEGRFKLKEGDWFEVQVEQTDGTSFLLKYELQKQLPNKNQLYRIKLEHFKAIIKYGMKVGYDSYYPTFEENKSNPEIKNQFELEVSPTGEIVSYKPNKNNKSSKINLTEIGPKHGSITSVSYSDDMNDSLHISRYSGMLMKSDQYNKKLLDIKNKVPIYIIQPDLKLNLTKASFPILSNSVISGNGSEFRNKTIRISFLGNSMFGESSESYFHEMKFKSNDEGSFFCPIFLKRPVALFIQIGEKHLTTFMEPGDTLIISALGHQADWVEEGNFYRNTKPGEYFSDEKKKLDYFSGNAAYNTMLSNELDQYRILLPYPDSLATIESYCKRTTVLVNDLIESYRDKASLLCIQYFKSNWMYFIANVKLDLLYQQSTNLGYVGDSEKLINHKRIYPSEIDTIPILMNPFEWDREYNKYLFQSQNFKKIQIGTLTGQKMPYYFNLGTLSGYPLYHQLAVILKSDFITEYSDKNVIEAHYQDFLMNCSDPVLLDYVKDGYQSLLNLKVGNRFPIKSFHLQDSSVFNLDKFKGKPICLVIFDGPKNQLSQFKENIEKFSPDEVQFIFVKSKGNTWIETESDNAIWKMPNVSYIELADTYLKSELLVYKTRIFMLDKWFRIVENNAEDPMTHKYKGRISEFEKSLRRTIEAKRYSKAEKTAMIKTAGWSFGSILFTLLIGLWIYRVRIKRLKKQEAARRRIKELEIKAIRSQMNPHFIFNALNSIQSLINGNQFKEANIYLSKFAVLLRGVLNNSEKSRISLSDELQAVELYCQLEQLRFEFKFEISIDPELNSDLIEIPGMIIQPLAENAVVHGLSGKGGQGKLNIQVKRQNRNLCVCVSDNGVGLQSQKIDELSQKGFGLKLVEERINILNLDGKEAKLKVENRNDSKGTMATLIIPID